MIDVRPETEFHAGHIVGAVNIAVDSLPQHLKTLPKEQEIVAYCLFAVEAVENYATRVFAHGV